MVAILGPSGSGKTSLLNCLSQRIWLSGGSYSTGEVLVNGEELSSKDFGKVAAFVQQDDILTQAFTPRELLRFAATIRTNLPEEEIEKKVENTILRLGLTACANTRVGGVFRRGISGGERKRTSIGYELITEPSLLLMDEPTSGLDSSTALRIMQDMKRNAQRGMSILATIHQPSGPQFMLFDRVIVLSEGYVVYNGPPSAVKSYFETFGLVLGRFQNPADKLSMIAQEPLKYVSKTIKELDEHSRKEHGHYHSLERAEREQIIGGSRIQLDEIGRSRDVSTFKQIRMITLRSLVNSCREPMSYFALIFMAVFQGLLFLTIFTGVCADKFTLNQQHDTEVATNMLGLSYMLITDAFIKLSFGQVQQIP